MTTRGAGSARLEGLEVGSGIKTHRHCYHEAVLQVLQSSGWIWTCMMVDAARIGIGEFFKRAMDT